MTSRLVGGLLLVGALLLAACGPLTREAHPATLTNTAWRAVSINGQRPVAGSEPTARFMVTDANGSGGCNDWFSPYTYDPSTGHIAFTQLAMTARGCDAPALEPIEKAFSDVLVAVTDASIDPEGRLVLSGSAGDIVFAVDAVGG
ncbi:MAG TPA: META domain-containing protein [Candidatus Limnocylindrales bacterium]|nr:META domain-containing protein [Candidatus Limnocylindrales bacterium]